MSIFTRSVNEIIPLDELRSKVTKSVQSGTPLKIKLGLDPSAPDIHLGHTVVLNKLRQLITDLTGEEIEQIKAGLHNGIMHPRDAKMKLAATIVRMFHDEESAEQAQNYFISVFQQHALPDDIPVVVCEGEKKVSLIELMTQLKHQTTKTDWLSRQANASLCGLSFE